MSKIKKLLFGTIIGWSAIGLLVIILSTTLWNILVGTMAIFSVLAPKSTATEIAFYDGESFFGLPFNIDEKTGDSILTKSAISGRINIQDSINKLNSDMQERLDTKFGSGKYKVNFMKTPIWATQGGYTYNSIVNLTNGLENIETFGIQITNTNENVTEGIYFYSLINQIGAFTNLKYKINDYFTIGSSSDRLGYIGNGGNNILFLKSDNENINEQWKIFITQLKTALGNDQAIKQNTKEAFEYLFNNTEDSSSNFVFYPKYYNEYIDGKLIPVGSSCVVKYSKTEQNDLSCDDGNVVINISDGKGNILPISYFKEGISLSNVKVNNSYALISDIKDIGKNIIEMNGFKLNDSYFIDMANYVGIDETNSNQAILSKQKIDLSFFSEKQFGKSYKELLVLPTNLQNFTEENAKKILNYNEKDDVVFTVNGGENNTVKIFKNNGGYSVDGIYYKCKSGQNVVYRNFEDLINGFQITDDTSGSGKTKCSQVWNAPAVLKKAEVKYYKKFVFKGEEFPKSSSGTTKDATKYTRNDHLLNYFYNYEKPRIIDDSLSNNNILSNVDYISQVGLDKKSILWRGVYLKVSSYAGELKEDNPNGLSIKRDIRDGSVLFPDSPVRFEIGLLTELNNQTVDVKQNEKGEFISNTVNDLSIDNYINNSEQNTQSNILLDKFNINSVFDKISIEDFRNDPTLNFDIPAIYGEKKLKAFNNNYVDVLQKQQKLIDILNRNLYSSTNNQFTPESVLKKYITLYSKNKEGKNFDICSDYRKIAKIAEENMLNADSNDIKRQALRADSLNTIAELYRTCSLGYFPQTAISNKLVSDYSQSVFGLVQGSYMNYFNASAGDVINNDLYYLYDYILKNNDNLLEGDEVPNSDSEADILVAYFSFVKNYVLYNEGDDGSATKNKFIALYTNLALSNSGILLDLDTTKLVKSFTQEDKYFIEQEYFLQEVLDEPYSDSYKENTLLKDISSYSYSFDINNAFSFKPEVYNKSEKLHEITLNPNIYLYSFFHYTKTKNKTYNVNITNENKLMHYSAEVDKNKIDSNFLNEYTDHLSKDVLGEITKNNYKNIYIKLKNFCNTSGSAWNIFYIFSECKSAQSGNFADIQPEKQLNFLSNISEISNNSINKIGYIQNYKNNYPLYYELNGSENLSYIPTSFMMSSKFLYDKYNNGYKYEVENMGKVLLMIKLTNLYNYYSTSTQFTTANNMQESVRNINIARVNFVKYLFGIYSNYNNKAGLLSGVSSKSPDDLNSIEILDMASKAFKPKEGAGSGIIDYAPNISYDEYLKKVLTPIVAYLFNDSGDYKYNYTPSEEDKELLAPYFDDIAIKNTGLKIYGRTENPSGLYSYFQVKNNTVSYVSLKKSFEKVLSSTGTENIINNVIETSTGETSTGIVNNSGSTNTGVVYENISLGNVSSYINLGVNIFTGGTTETTYNVNQGVNKFMRVANDIADLKAHYGDTTYIVELKAGEGSVELGTGSTDNKFEDRELQIDILKKNKQCSAYLKENNAYLYYALYTYNVGRKDLYVIETPDQITTDDKIKIFRFFTENNKILNCNGLTLSEYQDYLFYTKNMINNRGDAIKYMNSNLIQEYELYTGINYTNIPTLTLGDDIFTVNDNILNTPAYVMLSKTFNYNNDKSKETSTKMNYKFIATTDLNGLPLDIGVSDRYRTDELMGTYYQLLLANTITNNVGLFNGLQSLSREMFNYSLNNRQEKVAFISEFKNLGPFYYLYTNNGFVNPNNGVKFTLVRADELAGGTNMEFNLMNIAMYGEKAGINEGLENISNTYCEQKSGAEKTYCKNYMEFLKGMDVASYKQEIEYITAMLASKKVLGKYPVKNGASTDTNVGSMGQLISSIQRVDNKFYTDYFSKVYNNERKGALGSYVGQCTWFAQLYKEYNFSGHGGQLGDNARNLGYSVEYYGGKTKDEKMKIIQVGDIISFKGWNGRNGCSTANGAGVFGHVGMVVGKDTANYTIDVAEGNVKNYFATTVGTYNVDKICPGNVIHNLTPRYGSSEVIFTNESIVPSNTNTGTTNSGSNL